MKPTAKNARRRMIDIGTGSGILLILGLLLGIQQGVGTDLDPCALAEAKENVRVNRLDRRAAITSRGLETFQGPFDVICANLRYPTLMRMRTQIARLAEGDALVVLSGILEEELAGLRKGYTNGGFDWVREESDLGWSGALLEKKK